MAEINGILVDLRNTLRAISAKRLLRSAPVSLDFHFSLRGMIYFIAQIKKPAHVSSLVIKNLAVTRRVFISDLSHV